MNDNLCWVDIETTGLDQKRRTLLLLEVGFAITTPDLEVLSELSLAVQYRPEVIDSFRRHWDPDIVKMHTDSGLLDECAATELWLECWMAVERAAFRVNSWLAENDAWGMTWAGSSLHFDVAWLSERMPHIMAKRTAYRVVDVSSWKEMLRRWRPDIVQSLPPPQRLHRALPDIHDSIAELAHYRERLGLTVADAMAAYGIGDES